MKVQQALPADLHSSWPIVDWSWGVNSTKGTSGQVTTDTPSPFLDERGAKSINLS